MARRLQTVGVMTAVLTLLRQGALNGLALLGCTVALLDWLVADGWASAAILVAWSAVFWFWKRQPLWGPAVLGLIAGLLGGASLSLVLLLWSAGIAVHVLAATVRSLWLRLWSHGRRPVGDAVPVAPGLCAHCMRVLAETEAGPWEGSTVRQGGGA